MNNDELIKGLFVLNRSKTYSCDVLLEIFLLCFKVKRGNLRFRWRFHSSPTQVLQANLFDLGKLLFLIWELLYLKHSRYPCSQPI